MADPTTINVQTVDRNGTALTFSNSDDTNGNRFSNDGNTWLEVVNLSEANSATVVIATAATIRGLAIASASVALSTTARVHVPPMDTSVFNDADGYVQLTYTGDGAADVDLAVYRRP